MCTRGPADPSTCCPAPPRPARSLFWRLDTFMERCHDMMDMMSTCVQFNKLERIEIGNTKASERECKHACMQAGWKQASNRQTEQSVPQGGQGDGRW